MATTSRHEQIIDRLREHGRVDVAELAVELQTSEVTIRRDLEQLAEAGVLRRVRGGAVSLMLRGEEQPFALRELQDRNAKQRIAARAAALIADGEAIVIDSGTTGVAVAAALASRRLTAMPLSLPAARALADSSSVELVLPGGTVRHGEGSFVGAMTEAGLRALRFDTAVLSCCGLSAGVVTAFDLEDAAVKRAAIASAARVMLVAEGAKFARTALAVVAPLTDVDVLLTDGDAPEEALADLRQAGVEVHRA